MGRILNALIRGVYVLAEGIYRFLFVPAAKSIERVRTLAFRPYSVFEGKLPEAYVKQIGTLQAEIKRRDKIIAQLKKEIELLRGKKKQELIRLIEKRREQLKEMRRKETTIIVPSNIKRVKVLSREGKFLGWLYGFSFRNNLIGIVVTTNPKGKGKKYIVHEAESIKDLIHNAHTFGHQLNVAKVITLTRTYDGVWIPDFEVIYPIYPGVATEKGFLCRYCGKTLKSFEKLVEHRRREHGVTTYGSLSEHDLWEAYKKTLESVRKRREEGGEGGGGGREDKGI